MKKISTLIMVMLALIATQDIQARSNQTKVNDDKETSLRYATKQPDPDFKFEKDEITIDLAQDGPYELPKLLNPNKLEVEQYAVTDTELASVDEEGNFKITALHTGDVTLYAKGKRNAKFLDSEAECLVHITNSGLISSIKFGSDAALNREGNGDWYEESAIPVWDLTQTSWWAYGAYKLSRANTAYLVSPEITLEGAESFQVEFEHTFHYVAGHEEDGQFVIREKGKDWVVIEGVKYPNVDSYAKVSSGKINIPAEFVGKTVEFGFKYKAEGKPTDSNWNIESFTLLKKGGTSSGICHIEMPKAKDNRIYDLQGRLVKNPSKGIYIINGRKVLVK